MQFSRSEWRGVRSESLPEPPHWMLIEDLCNLLAVRRAWTSPEVRHTVSISQETLDQLAISPGEYEAIVERLGREPNHLEVGLFGSMWSEHCGYKHSKPLLRQFNTTSERMLVAPGSENAGVVDIGAGLAVVMKVESHNHPSAIEPYEGAATGVGGIVRDIFAMGARPIALLNSLRFGPLTDGRNRYLFSGVVSGISGYGNCIGVPDVGGEVQFAPCYSGNPLVNAMCVGVLRHEDLRRATAGEPGNLLMLVGADTGRDGIHGASGLASRTFEDERELRPTVQVGNPFLEKVLIEACLEAAESDAVVGIQDLGAAGLTSSSVECASNAGMGIRIDIDEVPRRESGMSPYEVMLSESQERMLVVVRPGREAEVKAIFDRWDLRSDVVGEVMGDGLATISDGGSIEASVPVELLADPPLYEPPAVRPGWLDERQTYDLDSLPMPASSAGEVLLQLLASPNIASKQWIYRQYDHQVQTNTVVAPGGDAALLRVKGTEKGLAVSTDGNGRYCYLDPYAGGMIAVAEACRNVSCTGATPIALTDCLNFGNPERPETYYQLREAVAGMAQASRMFDAPVVSGNVSLYNETQGEGIYPTPVVGALGLTEDVATHATAGFKDERDVIVLLGRSSIAGDASELAGSEYLDLVHGLVAGRPTIDLELEVAVQQVCRDLIGMGLLKSAHDCSDGGLAVAIAECCVLGNVGADVFGDLSGRWDSALFGEGQSRIVVSLSSSNLGELGAACEAASVPFVEIGTVRGADIRFGDILTLPVEDIAGAYFDGLPNALGAGPRSAG